MNRSRVFCDYRGEAAAIGQPEGRMAMEEQTGDIGQYAEALYAAAVRKTGDAMAAEDLAQETFLAALMQLARGTRPKNMRAWLQAILSNKYCDWLREKYHRPTYFFGEVGTEPAAEMQTDETAEQLEAIRREIGRLGRIHREVFTRYYVHGQPVEQIAREMRIPAGTVKSRLNQGRERIRKGVKDMENYARQSYEPDTLHISCAGGTGLCGEPFSLVPDSDRLAQSILIAAYPKPLTEAELAGTLGVPAAFVEPVVDRLVEGELMRRTAGGKVYTDFILYTDTDRKANFDMQQDVTEKHFALFWAGMAPGLAALRASEWYRQQAEGARANLELHFCVKTLMNAVVFVRDEVTGAMPWAAYPYRRDGGRWIAMGMQYAAGRRPGDDAAYWKYSVDGESGYEEQDFRGVKSIELRCYGTSLGEKGSYGDVYDHAQQYTRWFFELAEGIPVEESAVSSHVLQRVERLVQGGFVKRGKTLVLNIPALTCAAWREETELATRCAEALAEKVRGVLLPVFAHGCVRLPSHLKSVPEWQRYMFCASSVPMMVIYGAMERGLLLKGVSGPLPAAVLICDRE